MSDIFISYTQENQQQAQLLAKGLEQKGWSVWWNKDAPAGQLFNDEADEALQIARCVIIIWSQFSVSDRWISSVAREASKAGTLLPALFEDVFIPVDFRDIPTANLIGWNGDPEDPFFQDLVKGINGLLQRAEEIGNAAPGDEQQGDTAVAFTSLPSEPSFDDPLFPEDASAEPINEQEQEIDKEATDSEADSLANDTASSDPSKAEEGSTDSEDEQESFDDQDHDSIQEKFEGVAESEQSTQSEHDPESGYSEPEVAPLATDKGTTAPFDEKENDNFSKDLETDPDFFEEAATTSDPQIPDTDHITEEFDAKESQPNEELEPTLGSGAEMMASEGTDFDLDGPNEPKTETTAVQQLYASLTRQPKLVLYGGLAAAVLLVLWGIFQILPNNSTTAEQTQTLPSQQTPAANAPPSSEPSPGSEEDLLWSKALEKNEIAGFEAYKEQYPEGKQIAEAQRKIISLQSEESAKATLDKNENKISSSPATTRAPEGFALIKEGNFFTTKQVTMGPMRPSDPNQNFRQGERVYIWATINAPAYEKVKIEWLTKEGRKITEKYVNVARDLGNGFNIHDWKQNFPGGKGEFKVRLLNSQGEKIAETEFSVN